MKSEKKITDRLSRDMNDPRGMDRRDFMKWFGGGLVIAFSVGEMKLLSAGSQGLEDEKGVNAYLRIGEDGHVTLFTGKIEMGQGPITSLPMMLADELDVDLDSIDILQGDTDLCPWDEGTYGSLSTRVFGQTLRAAGAEARAILLKMASKELSVPAEELNISQGVVSAASDPSRSITYAELTKGKKILETVRGKPSMKKASEFRIMGNSRLHSDGLVKVTGDAMYSGDIKLEGLMRARILRPPSLGAKLVSVDTSGAESMEGIEIIRDGDFIAVLHESQDMADIAIAKVKAEYEEEEPEIDQETLYAYLTKTGTNSREVGAGGDIESGENRSEKLIESEYHDPYLAHAPIETHTATAVFEGEKLKIWASCQTPYPTRRDVAEELGIPEKNVRLMEIFTGGGFGGKIYNPQVLEAARLAKLSKKPVQLVYTRREEFMYDRLRPSAVVKIRSGLDGGRISFWDYGIYFGGTRGAAHFYDIPDHRTIQFRPERGSSGHLFYTGAWRAPSNNTNTFARESQMEILAAAAGEDALDFRLKHLEGNQKMANVLKKGAEKFGWKSSPCPSGRGYGLACGVDAGTFVAVFVEVEVDETSGHVQVKRAVCSQDMGMVVNPQGAIIQAEGCMVMGLGYALGEEIEFEGRKMLTRNFDTYGIAKFSWTPELDVVLVDAQDEPPQGGGEPAIICMGGAIANAVFDATGARLYRLPMTKERVLTAIRDAKK